MKDNKLAMREFIPKRILQMAYRPLVCYLVYIKSNSVTFPKMGYYIRGSCILMRWSDGLHVGQGTAVCDLGIENTVAYGLHEY